MANSDGDIVYSREPNSTGWFVGIIVALALLAIFYLVFSANSQPSSTAAPAPLYDGLFDSTVVGDGQTLLLKKPNGSCVSVAFGQPPAAVDCPTADPAAP